MTLTRALNFCKKLLIFSKETPIIWFNGKKR